MTRWLWRLVVALVVIGAIWNPELWIPGLVFVGAVVTLAVIVVALALDSEAHQDARRRNEWTAR